MAHITENDYRGNSTTTYACVIHTLFEGPETEIGVGSCPETKFSKISNIER